MQYFIVGITKTLFLCQNNQKREKTQKAQIVRVRPRPTLFQEKQALTICGLYADRTVFSGPVFSKFRQIRQQLTK